MSRRLKIRWIFGLLIMLFLPVRSASAASNTVLKTSVPNSIILTLEIRGNGIVWVGDWKCSDSQTVTIPRNEKIIVSFQADTGYRLSSVKLNGIDISQQLDNNSFLIDTPDHDMALTVVFLHTSAIWPSMNPPTGDYHIGVLFHVAIFSLVLLLLLSLPKNRKK